jgi:hypothetical protein
MIDGPVERETGAWIGALNRLHEDLSGLEQVEKCLRELLASLRERRANFSVGLISRIGMQWLAIGIRRVFREGSPRYPNVALERVLKDMSSNAELVLEFGNASQLSEWLEGTPEATAIRECIDRERSHAKEQVKDAADYANTIAHLQHVADDRSDELRITLGRLSALLAHARVLVDRYHLILAGSAPKDLNGDRFVVGFEAELERLLVSAQ